MRPKTPKLACELWETGHRGKTVPSQSGIKAYAAKRLSNAQPGSDLPPVARIQMTV
jgi:hypothetical protein